MSDFIKYLNAVLTGDTANVPEPDTNVEKYLAKALGIWDGPLPAPLGDADALLYLIAEKGIGGGGGGELPVLTNPAALAQILSGYEAINQAGSKMTGTMPNIGAVSERLTRSDTSYTVPKGFHDGNGKVYIEVQEKSVEPTSEEQEVTPDTGKLLAKVIVGAAAGGDGGDTLIIRDARCLFSGSQRVNYYEDYFKHIPADAAMAGLFKNASMSSVREIDCSTLDTSKNTDFTSFFEYFTHPGKVKMETLRVVAATKMGRMFYAVSDYGFTNPDFSSWDVSNVTEMQEMFTDVRPLTSPNFSGWDTSKVKNMSYMFGATKNVNRNDNCKELDISSFNTGAVTNMKHMFSNLQTVKKIIVGEGFTTAAAYDMSYMFSGCNELEELPPLDFSGASTIQNIFQSCTKLKGTIDMGTYNGNNTGSAFGYCKCLEGIVNMKTLVSGNGLIGFSSGWLPNGSSSDPAALKRLTFGYGVENTGVTGMAYVSIQYCSFRRENVEEFFNSLPNIASSTANATYKRITLTGNPCVLDTISLTAQSSVTKITTWEDFLFEAKRRYRGYDISNAQMVVRENGSTTDISVTPGELDKETFEGYYSYRFLADTITIPEEDKLTDEVRAIATNKGWTLIE